MFMFPSLKEYEGSRSFYIDLEWYTVWGPCEKGG